MKYLKYKSFEKEYLNLLSLYKRSKESIKVQIRNEIRKNGFLEIALKNKNYKVVSAIINMDRKAISEGFFKDSELILNIMKFDNRLFKFLLESGLDINFIDDSGTYPLYEAVCKNDLTAVGVLLRSGANPNILTSRGDIPLYKAVNSGFKDIFRKLLSLDGEQKVEIDQRTKDGITTLYLACRINRVDFVEYLLQARADANMRMTGGYTPLYLAVEMGNINVVKMLLHYRESNKIRLDDKSDSQATALYIASHNNKVEIVKMLLNAGANPNIICTNNFTALYIAIKRHHHDLVEPLLNAGADPNITSILNETALYNAVRSRRVDIVKMLLKAGANPSVTNTYQITPLILAAETGNVDVVKALFFYGKSKEIDLGHKVCDHFEALYSAIKFNKVEVVKMLLNAGVNPNITGKDGMTPIYYAASHGYVDVVKALLLYSKSKKIDLNQKVGDQSTALYVACKNSKLDVVKVLLDVGANPNIICINGETALYVAAGKAWVKAVKRLLKTNRYTVCEYTKKARYAVAYKKCIYIVKALLEAGADPNITCEDGLTALHAAAMNERGEILELLLEKGATKFNCESALTLVSTQSLYQKALERKDEKILLYEQFLSECPRPGPLAYSWAGAVFRAGQILEKQAKVKELYKA